MSLMFVFFFWSNEWWKEKNVVINFFCNNGVKVEGILNPKEISPNVQIANLNFSKTFLNLIQ